MRLIAFGFLLGFFVGFIVTSELKKHDFPKYLIIEKGGKEIGYAHIDNQLSKMLNVTDTTDPGMFLAFPIYGDSAEFQS